MMEEEMDQGMTNRRYRRLRSVAARRQLDLAVVLENVHDMRNVGAVLRSCEATGIQSVFLLMNDPSQKIKNVSHGEKTSSGARKWLNVYSYQKTEDCLGHLREKYHRILGTGPGGGAHSLYALDLTQPTALVFGNEHDGLSEKMKSEVDGLFTIPQFGMVQSLNISVACAVTLYETLRQRKRAGKYPDRPEEAQAENRELFEEFKRRHFKKKMNG